MTEQEIIEGNELIARFDGWVLESEKKDPKSIFKSWKIYTKSNGSKHECYSLDYHTNWSSLMPVVEKIENIEQWVFDIYENKCEIQFGNSFHIDDITFEGKTKIEATYKAVIKFIKWYNEQTSNN